MELLDKKNYFFPILCTILLFLVLLMPLPLKAESPTLIQVSPLTKTVSAGQTFSLNLSCTPGQSIKSYEFKLSFDPSLLQVNSVTEGTIFNGYPSFFNAGVINNTAGTIIDVYGLIVGNGNVSNQGTLVSISFTAQSASGSSVIGLFDVGITNETSYVPIAITNGTVIIGQFTLNVSIAGSGLVTKNPDYLTYPFGTVVQLTAVAEAGWMFNSWGGDLSGSANPTSITMTDNKSVTAIFTQNQYTLTIMVNGTGSVIKNPDQTTYGYGTVVTLTAVPGTGWAFTSWSGDLLGNQNPAAITITENKMVIASFVDIMPAQISSLTRSTADPLDTDPSFGWVNISCTVVDNVGVSEVVLQVHNPNGSWNNISMINTTLGQYYYQTTTAFSTVGNYSYSIWAKDSSNNTNISSNVGFSMPPNWDVNLDGDCLIFDLVFISNHYGETGVSGWIREDVDNNGEIEVLDLVYVSNYYGESWWV